MSTSTYTGHETTKYDTMRAIDHFSILGKRYVLLENTLEEKRYVISEWGDCFVYETDGDYNNFAYRHTYCSESGGTKARAMRKKIGVGGSVYSYITLWNKPCLTHKIVQKFIDNTIPTSRFYKGRAISSKDKASSVKIKFISTVRPLKENM